MSRKKRLLSQSQKMRTSMKMALVVGVASISGLVALLLIVFNVSKREISRASNSPMQFLHAEAFQDTTAAFRGSSNRPVIGVVVETRGNTTPVKITSFTFSMNGTTRPIVKNVENARLWFTGSDNKFSNVSQSGATITSLPEGEFMIEANKTLKPGKNYFWLSVDVKPNATPNGSLDAEIVAVNVGGNSFLPLISAPFGEKKIRNNSSFYSTGNNKDVSKPESWNSSRDGKGTTPANLNDVKSCFFIQSGHQAYVGEVSSLPMVAIESGAKLVVDENTRINELNISYGGIYQLDVAANDCACINKLKMEDGSTYIHNSTGIFAASSAVLSKHSNVIFYKYDEKTFARNIKWGNVIIDAGNSLHVNMIGSFKEVQGDLEIKSTAGNALYVEGTDAINIKGNFIVSGGIFEGVRGNRSRLTLNIGKDFIVKGGEVKDVENSYTSNASTTINVGGDVLFAAGSVDLNNSENKKSELNLSGAENKLVHWTQKSKADVTLCNVNIKPDKEVFLNGDKLGDIGKGKTFTVEANAKLWCATYPVTGEGRFVLNDKATLATSHAKGINSKGNEGNIITAERHFNSGGNYVFYGNSSPQRIGDFDTSPENGSVRNLVVKKDSPKQSVILSKNIFISEQVSIALGELNKGKYLLELSDVNEMAGR